MIVCGSGPSLLDDLEQCPKDVELISVNGHAATHFKCDYMAFLDEPPRQKFPDYDIKLYSPFKGYSFQEFTKLKFWNSGALAVWLACELTNSTVYLCGFGLFERGKPRYFYESDIIQGSSQIKGLNAWKQAWPLFKRPNRIKIISGPLKQYFE